jgi:hypothetical protein
MVDHFRTRRGNPLWLPFLSGSQYDIYPISSEPEHRSDDNYEYRIDSRLSGINFNCKK